MHDIQFEEDRQYARSPLASRRGMSEWLVRKGVAANQTSADRSLLVTVLLVAALIVGVLAFSGGGNTLDHVDSRAIRDAWPGTLPLRLPPRQP